jgi:hypothetical protein
MWEPDISNDKAYKIVAPRNDMIALGQGMAATIATVPPNGYDNA